MGASVSEREAVVREWLLGQKVGMQDIRDDYDLIENRVIDSLQFVQFVLLLEGLIEREIPIEQVSIDQFRTMASIRQHFLDAGAAC